MAYRYFAFLALALSFAACKGREHHDPLALPATSQPEKPKKPLSELFGGKAPTFPAFFHGAKPGMKAEEARKLIPGIDKDDRFELPDYGQSAYLYIDSDTKKVRSLNFYAGDNGLELAKAAWGAPKVVKDIGGRDLDYWFNPAEHVRAKIDMMMKSATVTLDDYMPFTEFLGTDKTAFAFEKMHPLLGQSPDDVKKNYAPYVVEKSAAENKATMDKIQAFAGTKANLGEAQASLDLSYPPSEWETIPKTVSLHFEKGKLSYFAFDISYESYPGTKDEVLAFLKKTHGEPKSVKDLGDTLLVFGKSPKVKVKDETITKAWSFTVEK